MAIWYILWSFGILLPVLVFCTKKNLATLNSRVGVRAHSVQSHRHFCHICATSGVAVEKPFVKKETNLATLENVSIEEVGARFE
jgi:hypothetical protein